MFTVEFAGYQLQTPQSKYRLLWVFYM